jgi:hypothetical protein
MSYVVDDKGLVHDVMDNTGTICGRYHSAWATAEAGAFVTCFACMRPDITKDCGHAGAEIMNCPYAADIRNNREERCKCCDACSRQCAEDI